MFYSFGQMSLQPNVLSTKCPKAGPVIPLRKIWRVHWGFFFILSELAPAITQVINTLILDHIKSFIDFSKDNFKLLQIYSNNSLRISAYDSFKHKYKEIHSKIFICIFLRKLRKFSWKCFSVFLLKLYNQIKWRK